jgi:hypothetical protein
MEGREHKVYNWRVATMKQSKFGTTNTLRKGHYMTLHDITQITLECKHGISGWDCISVRPAAEPYTSSETSVCNRPCTHVAA